MERHLTVRRFFVGERYTIADIARYGVSNASAIAKRHLGDHRVGGAACSGCGDQRACAPGLTTPVPHPPEKRRTGDDQT
jgi:glutathione S-transferase